jgi:low affinity Fe/Cu permease
MNFRAIFTAIGNWASSPMSFAALLAFTIFWAWYEPETLDLHGVATLVTWFLTICILRADHRDTQAVHVKLDELLKGVSGASEAVSAADDDELEEIREKRDQ